MSLEGWFICRMNRMFIANMSNSTIFRSMGLSIVGPKNVNGNRTSNKGINGNIISNTYLPCDNENSSNDIKGKFSTMPIPMAISIAIFFGSTAMAISMSISSRSQFQFQWQYQYQFFFLWKWVFGFLELSFRKFEVIKGYCSCLVYRVGNKI